MCHLSKIKNIDRSKMPILEKSSQNINEPKPILKFVFLYIMRMRIEKIKKFLSLKRTDIFLSAFSMDKLHLSIIFSKKI